MSEIRFNINDKVRFRLTEDGAKSILRHEHALVREFGGEYSWFEHHKPDADGWHTEQLWHLMEMLGPDMTIGGCLIVDNVIVFCVEAELVEMCDSLKQYGRCNA